MEPRVHDHVAALVDLGDPGGAVVEEPDRLLHDLEGVVIALFELRDPLEELVDAGFEHRRSVSNRAQPTYGGPVGPSETARRVAAHRLSCDRAPGPGHPELDDALANDVAEGVDVTDSPLHGYLCARTRFVDDAVLGALDDGLATVVLLGAGYDGRAHRYARPGATFVEVDLEATQGDKRARLERLGIDDADVRYVAADLTSPHLASSLAAAIAPGTPAIAVLEGVLPYLPDAAVPSLLATIGAMLDGRGRLALTAGVDPDRGGPDHADRVAAFRRGVAALGEPAVSTVRREELERLVVASGFAAEPLAGSDPGLGFFCLRRAAA